MLSCLASANGCINDASRAWFAMGRDQFIPRWFGGVHPKYKTPYRAILFLVPIMIAFGYTGLLDQVITFSIISGLSHLLHHAAEHDPLPTLVPDGFHQTRVRVPVPSAAVVRVVRAS